MTKSKYLILIVFIFGSCGLFRSTDVFSQEPTEYRLKAAFLYNFTKFTEWPSEAFTDSSSPFIIGILGDDPFGEDLELVIEGKISGGRSIIARRFGKTLKRENFENCHILFISRSERRRLPLIFRTIQGLNILTVGESERFAYDGGVVNLFIEQNKVRFEINIDNAAAANLNISSRILRLANIIRNEQND